MAPKSVPPRDEIEVLLAASEEYPQTVAEAREELAASGVDVDAFLARLDDSLRRERLGWQQVARARITAQAARSGADRYGALDRAALLAEIARRPTLGAAPTAFHHRFEEETDDDLRSLLTDDDDLGEPDP